MINIGYADYVKNQVSEKDWKTLQKLGVTLDTKILAELWPDFVNFEERKKSETPFLLSQLEIYRSPKVFDACLGSGATTIGLKLAGINDIVSNEIDNDLIAVAKKESEKYRQPLNITSYDWRSLGDVYPSTFDVVLCLGNSLTYLFKKDDQLQTLRNFRQILKPNGTLIIDERNYVHHFLNGLYRYSGEIIYCGEKKVSAHPIHISETMIIMEYRHKDTGKKTHLALHPFKQGEMETLLREAGFSQIISYGDYERLFIAHEPEFIIHCCKK
jgi:SAM-dependent methyltransferase